MQNEPIRSQQEADIRKWYKQWVEDTKRSGGVLIGSSIQELLIAFDNSKNNKNG